MNQLVLLTDKQGPTISKYLYGQFSEHLGRGIYGGIWVGKDSPIPNRNGIRSDVVAALQAIKVPVVRWPGGCFADEYHWRDGIGPRQDRKKIVNTNWGGVTEDNSFGTHEYFEFLRQIGADAYVNGNVGSGTVKEMSEWIEYMTMPGESPMAALRRKNGREQSWPVTFFGVGNENWGCGGNMRPEYYTDLFRRYQTFIRQFGKDKIKKIACGPNSDDYKWTNVLLERAARFMDGISLHYYTIPTGVWSNKGDAIGFPVEQWWSTIDQAKHIDELITRHATIMDRYDPNKRIGLVVDEWGTWYNVEKGTNPGFLYQQNSIRDAMVAAITLNIFHQHADRVRMANIAQTINVLQSMLLTENEKMVKTPTYYVFDLYKVHQGAQRVESYGDLADTLTCTASKKQDTLNFTVCNYSLDKEEKIELATIGGNYRPVKAEYITADHMDAHNTFDAPNVVTKRSFDKFSQTGDRTTVAVPPMSVVTLTFGE